MRAARIERLGTTPTVTTIDEPTPGPGEVVAPVECAGLNPLDLRLGSGQYGDQPTPHTVGREAVVTFDGRRHYATRWAPPNGTMAERMAVDPKATIAIPDAVSTALALVVGSAGSTALLTLETGARMRRGESVLVLGASGAVGQLAVQIARSLGASRIVGAARNLDALRDLPLDGVVRIDDGTADALRDTSGNGFDVVIDAIGGAPLADAVHATADGARIVTFGIGAGRAAAIDTKALQGRSLIGFGAPSAGPEVRRAAYLQLLELAAAGELRMAYETFPLDEIARAWRLQEQSPNRKLLIVP